MDEPLEGPVVVRFVIHEPEHAAPFRRGVARLEERALAIREPQTERRRRRVAAVDALRTDDRRTKDRRDLVLDLSRHRGPGRLRLSALPRHWTSSAATTR